MSDKVVEAANLTSMGITTHGFALNAIQDAAWVAGLAAGAIVVTFVSLCLPDNEGQSTSNY